MDRYVMEVLGEDDDTREEVVLDLPDDLVEEMDGYLVDYPTWSYERLIREALQNRVYDGE